MMLLDKNRPFFSSRCDPRVESREVKCRSRRRPPAIVKAGERRILGDGSPVQRSDR